MFGILKQLTAFTFECSRVSELSRAIPILTSIYFFRSSAFALWLSPSSTPRASTIRVSVRRSPLWCWRVACTWSWVVISSLRCDGNRRLRWTTCVRVSELAVVFLLFLFVKPRGRREWCLKSSKRISANGLWSWIKVPEFRTQGNSPP